MSKNKTLYKVVMSNLTSVGVRSVCYPLGVKNPFILNYSETDFVFGFDGSKIFCFSNLDDARAFNRSDAQYDGRIFEVETLGRRIYPKRIAPLYAGQIEAFWKARAYGKRYTGAMWNVMAGTVFVDAVKLVKEIR